VGTPAPQQRQPCALTWIFRNEERPACELSAYGKTIIIKNQIQHVRQEPWCGMARDISASTFRIPGAASASAAANAASALARFAGVEIGPPRNELVKLADAAAAPIGEVMDERLGSGAAVFAADWVDLAGTGVDCLDECNACLVVWAGVLEVPSAAGLLADFGVGTGAGVDGILFGLLGGNGDAGTDNLTEAEDGFCE
jgi:hypothetical protein